MQCSFLEGKRVRFCGSLGVVHIPCIFELAEYCTQDRHKKCPLFHAPAKRGPFPDAVQTGGTKRKGP